MIHSNSWSSSAPPADHETAHDHGAEDAPFEHPRLQLRRDREILKDDQEDEQVVDAERQLDQIPCEILQRRLVTFPDSSQSPKSNAVRHDSGGPENRLAVRKGMGAPIQHPQVQDQENDDQAREGQPDFRRVLRHRSASPPSPPAALPAARSEGGY